MSKNNYFLADGRWQGNFGIGRFSQEILSRLDHTDIFTDGPAPLSLSNLIWLPHFLRRKQKHNPYKALFLPGFNPVIRSPMPYIFTICDLIPLHMHGKASLLKKLYFELLVKSTAHRAHHIVTISNYSKKTILEWTNISEDKITVVNCGVSSVFNPAGLEHKPGYPYLLYVGNTKPHKNLQRLLLAFAHAKIDPAIRLILTGKPTKTLAILIQKNHLNERIIWSGTLSEAQLANYYRGAIALLFPSLYEGFGLPVLEAFASGTPALTSNVTSLPEIAGNAALIVDPYEVGAIQQAIEQLVIDTDLREKLIRQGYKQAELYSWDKAAMQVQELLAAI